MLAEPAPIVRKVGDIEYRLLPGTARQTTDIVIERDGGITVRPPTRLTPEQVDDTVLSRRHWIYRNLAEWRDLNATRVVREWVKFSLSCTATVVVDATPRRNTSGHVNCAKTWRRTTTP